MISHWQEVSRVLTGFESPRIGLSLTRRLSERRSIDRLQIPCNYPSSHRLNHLTLQRLGRLAGISADDEYGLRLVKLKESG